ncbi:MAG TPA: HD domain-containing phosphohydrolase [Noviherbaspirillum sp.]|uniref:HD-GYP domain-containing protein n=1 Tax=Noviherbaspirillum sp. TaxID=1926288 RepID=UPI002D33EDD2|nr:HD domain-containing phosphohydrolase [Noviherbaspirillum sp.]HYD96225.1 HD domain-containing phosphohydrolase [Noviherbaspirillum sp.]
MVDQRRLSIADIVIGEPLPWDVYGAGNKLLLRRGQVVANARQAEELVARGLFIDAGQAERAAQARKEAQQAATRERPSALRFINLANKRLERLLYNLANEADAQAKILEVVKALGFAADINADVAVASVFLNQAAGKYAIRHCIDTALVTLLISRAMNKPPEEAQWIVAAALTMNIAMLRQQDVLLIKQEPLNERETELIRSHPVQAVELLRQCGIVQPDWLAYVLLHHEKEDGSGYPMGPEAKDIPQNARILAYSDRYCASVSMRKYRKSLLPSAALRDVLIAGGKPADPLLAAYFIKELGTTPPGSFVRLQNGEIGVVTRRGKTAATPVVHAFIGPRGAPLTFPIQRDTGKELYTVREALSSDQAMLPFSMQQLWGDEAAL